MPKLSSFLPSVLRTVVPFVVAVVAGWPITQQLGVDGEQLTVAVSALVGGLYWLIVRIAETYGPSQLGWLLGYASAPVYATTDVAGKTATPVGDVVRAVDVARRDG